jgi:ATP-dependent DNA helicase RecG
LSCAEADLDFLRLVLEQENRLGGPLPIDTLLVLSELRTARRLDVNPAAALIQKDVNNARSLLERLVEMGLVQAHGVKRGRTYTLSPSVYRQLGQAAGYVRQAGFDRIQQEELVKRYVQEHGKIRRRDVMELCALSPDQATRLLTRLVEKQDLERYGVGKGSWYEKGRR